MTAARLEELAVWAENEQREQRFDGSFQRDQNYADLARCARAWAKVEAVLQAGVEISMAKTIGGEIQLKTSEGLYIWKDTALEAVEAAEVAK